MICQPSKVEEKFSRCRCLPKTVACLTMGSLQHFEHLKETKEVGCCIGSKSYFSTGCKEILGCYLGVTIFAITQWVFTSHEKFQISPCTISFITEVLVKWALLPRWMNLLFRGLYRTYFKSENWGLSGQMKIWQLTFLDSAYSKYESKLKLPLFQKNALIFVF